MCQVNADRTPNELTPDNLYLSDDEACLIEQAQQGNRWAISALFHRYVDVTYRYVYARVGDTATAQDLTCQIILRALEGPGGPQVTGKPFLVWIHRIAHARTANLCRLRAGHSQIDRINSPPPDTPTPGPDAQAEEDWVAAFDLLEQLTDEQQDVIILRFIGEMSLADTAETLGKTMEATQGLQHRALASLARTREAQFASAHDYTR